MRWLDGITDAMDMNLGKLQEIVRGKKRKRCFDYSLERDVAGLES